MTNPLVSVIISAYNRPSMLLEAIVSVQNQTYKELELIVQDDSSNDECEHIVARLADPKIRYTHNIPSLGTAENLFAGYRKATGKYFCTLNDDDLYASNYIETMVEQMEEHPTVSTAFCDHFVIDQKGQVLETETEQNTRHWRRNLLPEGVIEPAIELAVIHQSIPAMFAMFRRDSIDLSEFSEEVSGAYDYWLSYLAVRQGNPVYYTPRRLTSYRLHEGSQTAGFSDPTQGVKFSRYMQYIHQRLLSDPKLATIHPALRDRLSECYRSAGFALIKMKKRKEAMQEFIKSWQVRPNFRTLQGLGLCTMPNIILEKILRHRTRLMI